jgi:hypothetical protein
MKNKNLIVITLLATVLLSGAFVSLAAADDNVSDATTPPEPTAAPDRSATDSSDNSTLTQGDGVLFTIQGNSTAADDTQVPGEAEPNLIATQTGGSDDALIAAAVIALAVVLGTVGVVFYRKKAANAEK